MRLAADAVIYVRLWDFNCRYMITERLLGNCKSVAHATTMMFMASPV